MNRVTWQRMVTANIALLCSTSHLQAELVLNLMPDRTSVNVGEPITVTVNLTQDGSGAGGAADALTSGFGLTSFGVELTTSAPIFSPAPSGPTHSLPTTWNVATTPNTLSGFDLDLVPPITFNPLAASVGTPIHLAHFTLLANAPGTTLVGLSDLNPVLTNFGFDNVASDLDSSIFSSVSSIALTAIPEPSGVLQIGLLGLLVAGVHAYQRHAWKDHPLAIIRIHKEG